MRAALIIVFLWAALVPANSIPSRTTHRVEGVLGRYQYSQLHMGVRVTVTCYASDEQVAEKASSAAFARFAELEQVMSDYRPSSELMRLSGQAGKGAVPISPDLYKVLARSQEVATLSGGAFDVTCGPFVQLWRGARRIGAIPESARLDEARSIVGYRKLQLDKATRTASLDMPGMRLDLGGIAKGYACDEALKAIAKNGVTNALIEAGGDIVASGSPPRTEGWRIAIKGQSEPYSIDRAAISTSGDSEQFIEIAGKRYSHIVDPRTGLGLTNGIQATVIAPDGITSDSLATAACVLGEKASRPLLERYGARAIFSSSRRVAADSKASPRRLGPRRMILVFSKTAGYRHESIPAAQDAVRQIAKERGWGVLCTEDPSYFTPKRLETFDAVLFLLTTGDVLNDEQQNAMTRFIRKGGGYVGVHAATDTEYDWPWYGSLAGAWFASHPAIQEAVVRIEDAKHPSTSFLPNPWKRTDEWYDFRVNPRPNVRVLATVDESTYQNGKMGKDHPCMWCHDFEGGRAWYTAMGHTSESYSDPLFLRMLSEGIEWSCQKRRR